VDDGGRSPQAWVFRTSSIRQAGLHPQAAPDRNVARTDPSAVARSVHRVYGYDC
jgi:hypothetical protein